MPAKPDTETGWSKGLPDVEGDYFSRIDEYDKLPTLIRIENGAVYEMGQGGNLRREYAAEDYEYLGPFTPSDFEELIRLRESATDAANWIEAQTWTCWHPDQPMRCTRCATRQKAKELVAALREALGHKGEQS